MKSSFLILAVFLIAGCASLSDGQLESREYRNLDWRNQYIDYRQRCSDAGGQMLVDARGGSMSRDGIPNRGDYYTCSRRIPSTRGDS